MTRVFFQFPSSVLLKLSGSFFFLLSTHLDLTSTLSIVVGVDNSRESFVAGIIEKHYVVKSRRVDLGLSTVTGNTSGTTETRNYKC